MINFNEEFNKFFVLLGGEINPIINDNPYVDINKYAIRIDTNDIEKDDEQDEDGNYNTFIANGRFTVFNIENPEEEYIMQLEDEKEIYLSDEALYLMKKHKGLMYFRDMDDNTKLFEIVIMNKELTRPLYALMKLLDKQKNKKDGFKTIDEFSQSFFDTMVEAGIDANIASAEIITNRLLRSKADMYRRPDFSKEDLEDYNIITVSSALEKNKSPLIGLTFQNIKRQLLSDDFYDKRDGTSFVDPFFYTDIPTDNLKEYAELTNKKNKK